MKLANILLIFLGLSAAAWARQPYPVWLYNDNLWLKEQQIHLQTQQQLQSQDQYRRLLLMQDQQRQLERLQNNQQQMELRQRNSIMYEHADKLRMYSNPLRLKPEVKKRN